jgi:hypothetical protein
MQVGKTNDNINQGLMDQFNIFIHLHQKMRAKIHWTNKQLSPVMVTMVTGRRFQSNFCPALGLNKEQV